MIQPYRINSVRDQGDISTACIISLLTKQSGMRNPDESRNTPTPKRVSQNYDRNKGTRGCVPPTHPDTDLPLDLAA